MNVLQRQEFAHLGGCPVPPRLGVTCSAAVTAKTPESDLDFIVQTKQVLVPAAEKEDHEGNS